MIEESYVSFETAKLLKEKWFDKDWVDGSVEKYLNGTEGYSLPTLAIAMKWLREVHHIFIQIELYSKYDDYNFEIFQNTHRLWIEERTIYSTYTETVEMGIKYCLEHLI